MGNSDDSASKYQEITSLGEGAFGKAYKVLNKGDKKFYVNKKIRIIEENPDSESFENEVEILKKFNSEYIVKYYESFTKDNYYNIIIEYCENGDLASFIKKHKTKNNFINEKVIYYIAIDICKGIKEIHNMKLIHRDLKPDNLFISKDYKIKIGDFGVSKQLSTKKYAKSQAGTYNYMAPEMINGEVYNRKVDIWSLGCILYELLTLEYCFDEPSIGGLINLIISGNHGKIDTKKYNSKWQNIIDIMLKLDYHDRPEIDEVFQLIYNIGQNNSIYNDKNLNILKLDEISVNILRKNKIILKSPLKDSQTVDKNKLFENKAIQSEKGKIEFQNDNSHNDIYKIFEESKCIPDIIEYYPVENIESKINNIIYYEENINSLDLINNIYIFEKYINGAFILCPDLDSFKIINEEINPVYKKNNKIKFNIIIGGKNIKKVLDFMEENKDSYKFIENKCLYMNESKNYDNFKTILPIYENKNDVINYIKELSTNENKPYPIKRLITYETYLEKYKEIHFKISQFYGDLNLETFKNNISQMKNSKIKEDLEFIFSKLNEDIITFDIKKDITALEKLIIKKNTFDEDLNRWLMKTIFSKGGCEYYMSRFIYYLNLYAQKNKKFFSENNKELYIGCKRPYSYILQYERAKGKIILITSFKSSSEKKETAFNFAGRNDPSQLYRMKHFFSVIFIIRNIYKNNYIPNGIKVENLNEIVFLPFSFFYIKKVQVNLKNYTADIYLDTIGKKEILEEQIKKGREIKYNEIENIMEIS